MQERTELGQPARPLSSGLWGRTRWGGKEKEVWAAPFPFTTGKTYNEYTLNIRKVDFVATSVVNVRLDEQTKRDLEVLCQELGITVSAAFSMFAKKMTREQRIPFEVSIDPFYSEANVSMLRRSVAQVKGGNLTERELIDE